jgi:hypothetical protein
MGLAGLLALSTADSGMPTVTAARPFRWGWRCLGEQRDDRVEQFAYPALIHDKILNSFQFSSSQARHRMSADFSKCELSEALVAA